MQDLELTEVVPLNEKPPDTCIGRAIDALTVHPVDLVSLTDTDAEPPFVPVIVRV